MHAEIKDKNYKIEINYSGGYYYVYIRKNKPKICIQNADNSSGYYPYTGSLNPQQAFYFYIEDVWEQLETYSVQSKEELMDLRMKNYLTALFCPYEEKQNFERLLLT